MIGVIRRRPQTNCHCRPLPKRRCCSPKRSWSVGDFFEQFIIVEITDGPSLGLAFCAFGFGQMKHLAVIRLHADGQGSQTGRSLPVHRRRVSLHTADVFLPLARQDHSTGRCPLLLNCGEKVTGNLKRYFRMAELRLHRSEKSCVRQQGRFVEFDEAGGRRQLRKDCVPRA